MATSHSLKNGWAKRAMHSLKPPSSETRVTMNSKILYAVRILESSKNSRHRIKQAFSFASK